MALKTGNPYLDAIGGTASPDRVVTIFFDNDTSAGPVSETSAGNFSNSHSTGGAWTAAEKSAFWDAMHTWTDVADIRFLEVDTRLDRARRFHFRDLRARTRPRHRACASTR